MLTRCKKTVQ